MLFGYEGFLKERSRNEKPQGRIPGGGFREALAGRRNDCCGGEFRKELKRISGGDACGGHTRSHPEHDG